MITQRVRAMAGRFLAAERGLTLVEVVLGVGLISMGLSVVGSSVFQALSIERYWRDDVVATKELRQAESWFAGDALNASSTSLVSGAPAADSVTLSWLDGDAVTHTVTYVVSGGELVRTYDGVARAVARDVTSASFSLSGRVLTFNLAVAAERGGTDSTSLRTFLRMLR